MTKKIIKNSTAEFLIFTAQSGKDGVEVRFEDETIWMSQKMMATLFEVTVPTINEHLNNIFITQELDKNLTIRKFRIVQKEGKRRITRQVEHYSLDVIISLGYRVNSKRATRFRQWATEVLKNYAIKGYVLDAERLKNGTYLGKEYFDNLLEEIREIRASERRFYQKITDIYSTAMEYNVNSPVTKEFFATVQNKLHYATHGLTAAELIKKRASSKKPNMGLTTWKNSPTGKIIKGDIYFAKNYLSKEELNSLNRFVTMYLDYAEDQAKRKIPMTMQDWADKLSAFLRFNEREVLDNPGKVSAEIAKKFVESEFKKYRITQDRLFESDFDGYVKKIIKKAS